MLAHAGMSQRIFSNKQECFFVAGLCIAINIVQHAPHLLRGHSLVRYNTVELCQREDLSAVSREY